MPKDLTSRILKLANAVPSVEVEFVAQTEDEYANAKEIVKKLKLTNVTVTLSPDGLTEKEAKEALEASKQDLTCDEVNYLVGGGKKTGKKKQKKSTEGVETESD